MPHVDRRPRTVRRSVSRLPACVAVAALLALAPSHVIAQAARALPARTAIGFSAERLARIDRFLQQYVDSNRVGGLVALVMRDGKVAYQRAVGWSDRESRRRGVACA